MRIFLTGGTGYIGVGGARRAGARRAPRRRAGAEQREGGAGAGARRRTRSSAISPSRRRYADAAAAADGVVHTALDARRRAARQIDRDGARHVRSRPRRGAAAVRRSTRRASGCSAHCPTPADESAPLNPIAHRRRGGPRTSAACSTPRPTGCARSSSARASSTAASRGIIGDLLKDAANGLVRVVGNGDNHWPLHLRPRPGGSLSCAWPTDRGRVGRSSTPTTKATSASNDIVDGDRRARARRARACATCRSPRRGRRWARTPTRWRSTRSSGARGRARSGWAPSLHSVAGNAARLVEEWRRGRKRHSCCRRVLPSHLL